MKRMLLIGLLLLAATSVWSIPGDLNLDGKVDFEDFFLFADQFGKEGPPDTLRVVVEDTLVIEKTVFDTIHITVYDTLDVRDTVVVTRPEVVYDTTVTYFTSVCGAAPYVAPPPGLNGTLDDLSSIDISYNYVNWSVNWDSDIDNDGLELGVWMRSLAGDVHSTDVPIDGMTYLANVQVYVGRDEPSDNWGEEVEPSGDRLIEEPVFEGDFVQTMDWSRYSGPIIDYVRIPYELFRPIPDDAVRVNTSRGYEGQSVPINTKVVSLIVEVRCTFADGAVYADRVFTASAVSRIDGVYRLHYKGDPAP